VCGTPKQIQVRFWVQTLMTLKMAAFWDTTSRNLSHAYIKRRSNLPHALQLQRLWQFVAPKKTSITCTKIHDATSQKIAILKYNK
jgi:hypothetical protein